MHKKKKRIATLLFVIVLGICGFVYVSLYLPYTRIKGKAMVVMASATDLKTAFSQNNIDLLTEKLKTVEEKYAEFEKESQSVYWLQVIPYVADFRRGVESGRYGIEAAKASVSAIAPYADLIGFKKGESSFVEKSAEGRLQTAVLTLDKVLSNIDVISENINQIESRLDQIDENRYPVEFGGTKVRETIRNGKDQFAGVSRLFVDAKPLLKKLPEILGSKEEKTYLLLFQNTAERRATGGFLTAYAVFKIKEGKISIDRSADIYSLDDSIAVHPAAPKEIQMYHKDVAKFYIRDSNLSPDFVESLKLFNSLYQKSGARVVYDGIIALDSKILVDMLTIFGDTEVGGVVFSAAIDKRCDCPQVIYQLFNMVGEEVGYQKENRKGILGDLMYELFYKALRFSPSRYWGRLAQTMFLNMDEKHILLNFVEKDLQQSVEKLNYAGRIRESANDYLHINNVNFAGAKSNLFVNEKVTSTTISDGGKVKRELVVEYRNPYPASNCNRHQERIVCLNATLRNWVRVYVPQGSKLVSFDGSETTVRTYDELGKTVFEGFLRVNPMGFAKIKVIYTLPEGVNGKELLIQKQSGVEEQAYSVTLFGKKLYDKGLRTDVILK